MPRGRSENGTVVCDDSCFESSGVQGHIYIVSHEPTLDQFPDLDYQTHSLLIHSSSAA